MKRLLREEVLLMVKWKNIFYTLVLVCLSYTMIIGSSTISSAAISDGPEIVPYYINITSCSVSLNISGIKAECKATVRAKSSMNLKIKMELQKEKSSGYETVKTWTSSNTGILLTMSESRNINILCNYRLKVTFTAGSETQVMYKYQ